MHHLHAQMELNASNSSKADSSADAKLDGKDLSAIKTLMIVLISHVHLEPTVPISSTTTDVIVPVDSMENDARTK